MKQSINTTGIQKHVQRENKNYNNQDIEPEKTKLNYDLIHGQEKVKYKELIEKRIEEGYTGIRKIRSDAIKHIDGMITSDKDFFNKMDPEQTKKYFADSLDFIQQEYGKENVLYATVHLDENTPHMHFGTVPLTEDGRLSAKDVVGNKANLTKFQDRYHQHMNEKGFVLERGQSKMITGAKNEQMDSFKQNTKYHEKRLEETKEKAMQQEKKLDSLTSSLTVQPLKYEKKEKKTEVHDKWMGKAEIIEKETENIIMTPKQMETVEQRVHAAYSIKKEYERLKKTDLGKENQSLQQENNVLSQEYIRLNKENADLKDKNKNLQKENNLLKSKVKDLSASLALMYYATKQLAKDKFKTIMGTVKEKAEKRNLKSVNQLEKKANQKEQTKGLSL